MEIEIDSTLVDGIVADEHAQAKQDIATLGVIGAYERSRHRHDARLADARDAPMLACKAGCYWCCYFSVDVRPVEVFAILDFIDAHLGSDEQARVWREIAANAELLQSLTDAQRAQRNIKCPFLNSGRCAIYAARPQTCRNYHATDAAGCKLSFEQPDNLDIDPEFAPLTYQSGGAHVDAFSKAMRDAGYDCDAYELSTALAAASADRIAARRRFEAKRQPFPTLRGTEVPLEFIDE
jgi:Fe-S-cluster containining protein